MFNSTFESRYFQFTVSQIITFDILIAFILNRTLLTKSILGLALYIQSTYERFVSPWCLSSILNQTWQSWYLEATKSISNQTCFQSRTKKVFTFILIHGEMRRSICYLTTNWIHTKSTESSMTWVSMDFLPISVVQLMMRCNLLPTSVLTNVPKNVQRTLSLQL